MMNLFDYIKFQNIDFSNMEETAQIPLEISIPLYEKISGNTVPATDTNANVAKRLKILTEFEDEDVKELFRTLLKEYYKEHHEPI